MGDIDLHHDQLPGASEDALHLRECPLRIDELEEPHGSNEVERGIGVADGSRIAHLEAHVRLFGPVLVSVIDLDGIEVDADQFRLWTQVGLDQLPKGTDPAPDIQDALFALQVEDGLYKLADGLAFNVLGASRHIVIQEVPSDLRGRALPLLQRRRGFHSSGRGRLLPCQNDRHLNIVYIYRSYK